MMISQHILNLTKPHSPPPPPLFTSSSPSINIHQRTLLPVLPAQLRYQKSSTMNSNVVKAAATAEAYSSDDVVEMLGDVTIFSATGESVNFTDLWEPKEGIAVVALLRHFGCPCCWEFADALKEIKPRLDAAGVKLIAIGVGTPNKARLLAERLPFPLDCLYCDPDRKAYDILGLYYGFGRTFFNPASVKVFSRYKELKKATKNYTLAATPDDRSGVLQQGGMFVFKGKQLLFARKDEGTGDHAPLDDILDICCKVPVA